MWIEAGKSHNQALSVAGDEDRLNVGPMLIDGGDAYLVYLKKYLCDDYVHTLCRY